MYYPWIIHGYPSSMDFPWIINGVSMDTPWIIHGLSMDYPRMSMDSPWTSLAWVSMNFQGLGEPVDVGGTGQYIPGEPLGRETLTHSLYRQKVRTPSGKPGWRSMQVCCTRHVITCGMMCGGGRSRTRDDVRRGEEENCVEAGGAEFGEKRIIFLFLMIGDLFYGRAFSLHVM